MNLRMGFIISGFFLILLGIIVGVVSVATSSLIPTWGVYSLIAGNILCCLSNLFHENKRARRNSIISMIVTIFALAIIYLLKII
jgi:uncharacterized membrane protein HdeD (DUF308 family)